MKNALTSILVFAALPLLQPAAIKHSLVPFTEKTSGTSHKNEGANLFIITIDGFRWQEIFGGADSSLINDIAHSQDTASMKMLYWAETATGRRQKLLPFFWSILARKGQLYGNRRLNNKVNTSNIYTFSYPGYNEILTGNTDLFISSNSKKGNQNINVLEYLNSKDRFRGQVVAFTSWDVFPFILNEQRSGILVNSGYEEMHDSLSTNTQRVINRVQEDGMHEKGGTRRDLLTFLTAKEYLKQHLPKVMFLGLGETDEYAHAGRYDMYLQQANAIDRMLGELWHWVQSTDGYRDNTYFLITTDHGRGKESKNWSSHSSFIRGSSQTWLALLGPDLSPTGEMNQHQQVYAQQLAQLAASLVGEDFDRELPLASSR